MGKSQNLMIRQVIPLEGWRLRLLLCTGSELLLNMANRLETVRFCPLKDEAVFNSVTTDGFYIHFDVEPNYALDFTLREALKMSVSAPGAPHFESDESESGAQK